MRVKLKKITGLSFREIYKAINGSSDPSLLQSHRNTHKVCFGYEHESVIPLRESLGTLDELVDDYFALWVEAPLEDLLSSGLPFAEPIKGSVRVYDPYWERGTLMHWVDAYPDSLPAWFQDGKLVVEGWVELTRTQGGVEQYRSISFRGSVEEWFTRPWAGKLCPELEALAKGLGGS